MATVPETHTFTSGVGSTSELNAYVRDPIAFLMNKPAAVVRQTVVQALTTATFTSITFTTEDLDDDPAGTGAHDTAVATSRYTAVYAGWYRCSGGVCFDSNATGQRGSRWAVNGTGVSASAVLISTFSGNIVSVPAMSRLVFLNVGDYVELQGYQSSGGNINTFVSAEFASSMSITWERLA